MEYRIAKSMFKSMFNKDGYWIEKKNERGYWWMVDGTIADTPGEALAALSTQEAGESTELLTPEELAALMERRAQDRNENWTKLERSVRLATGRHNKRSN